MTSQIVLIAPSEYPLAFMPAANGSYSLSRISFFFLPMARRSRSALPGEYPASRCAANITSSWYTSRP